MLLTGLDWLALGWSVSLWLAYFVFARRWANTHSSLLKEMNHHRRTWMVRMTYRENRISDMAGLANLTTSATFFASTTILIIGGLLALLGSLSEAVRVATKLPFIERTSEAVWELKIFLLIGIFVYAFFRFTWSLRLFNFATTLVGAAQLPREFEAAGEETRRNFANGAGRVVALATAAHNDGLRAYYFSIAAMTWLVQPLVFMIATAVVITVLYHREFQSQVLQALVSLRESTPGATDTSDGASLRKP